MVFRTLLPRALFIFLSLSLFVGSSTAFAQLREQTVDLIVTPDTPKANSIATFEVKSYAVDLNRSTISWGVNGVNKLIGMGERKFTATMGPNGKTTTITAKITDVDGNTLTKEISITPEDIVLYWQALDSYTPIFYKGKALPTYESTVRVVAYPDFSQGGSKIKPNNLIYTWYRNGVIAEDASGYGKNYITFKMDYTNPQEVIKVVATDINHSLSSENSITITPTDPMVVLYEDAPLTGINYTRALASQVSLLGSEATVIAEPFFFSAKSRNDIRLAYNWFLNNDLVENQTNPAITIRKATNNGGNSIISVQVNNGSTILQSKTRDLTVTFGN